MKKAMGKQHDDNYSALQTLVFMAVKDNKRSSHTAGHNSMPAVYFTQCNAAIAESVPHASTSSSCMECAWVLNQGSCWGWSIPAPVGTNPANEPKIIYKMSIQFTNNTADTYCTQRQCYNFYMMNSRQDVGTVM